MKKMIYIAAFLALASCRSGAVPGSPENLDPVWEGQARRMVDFIAQTHPNPWRRATKDEVLAAALRSALPGLSDGVRRVRLTAALAKLREGHTRPSSMMNAQRRLPLGLVRFSDGLVVVQVKKGAWAGAVPEELIGARLTSVGGQAVGAVQVRLADYACAENTEGVLAATPSLIVDADILADLGLVGADGLVALEFQTVEGLVRRVRVASLPGTSSPLLASMPGTRASARAGETLWTEVLAQGTAAYLAYNLCQDSFTFTAVVKAFLASVRDPAVTKVIVDLRTNPGGNSWPFTSQVLPALREAAKTKRLVVLAGPETFSSAIIALCELKSAGAVFVGSATSEGANSYGEVKSCRLEGARYEFITSSKLFQLLPGTAEGEPLVPDVRVEASSADFWAGTDVVLQSALDLP